MKISKSVAKITAKLYVSPKLIIPPPRTEKIRLITIKPVDIKFHKEYLSLTLFSRIVTRISMTIGIGKESTKITKTKGIQSGKRLTNSDLLKEFSIKL